MSEPSAEDIAQRAFGLELLDDRSFREVRGEITQKRLDAEAFRQLLLRRGLLTPYQMERLMRGERAGYFYGGYKVLYQVGAGTFARVYRAVHRETDKVFGVKVLRQRFTTEPKKCEQFRREAEVGITLRQPNIVAIYEVGAEKAAQYIVMEFVEGQSLREFIKIRKQIAPPDAVPPDGRHRPRPRLRRPAGHLASRYEGFECAGVEQRASEARRLRVGGGRSRRQR